MDLPTSHPGGDVYMDLHQHGVEFIPTPIAAGDVHHGETSMFCTRTQNFLPDKQPALILYRLLLKEIAEPFENYGNSKELVSALYECITGSFVSALTYPRLFLPNPAHEQAWTKAKVLHRDISVNNILI